MKYLIYCRSLDPATRWHLLEDHNTEKDARKIVARRVAATIKYGTSLEYEIRKSAEATS